MAKREVITRLRKAKTAHIRWRGYAQALIAGVPLDEDRIPIAHTDCEFGRWYYGAGQTLQVFPQFHAIAAPHEQLHLVYMQIVKQLFESERGGLLARLLGRRSSAAAAKSDRIQQLLDQLLQVSEQLMGPIETLEQAVAASDDDVIAALL